MVAAVFCLSSAALAAGPAGPEFQVNTYTSRDQSYPAACIDGGGRLAVVWESRGQDGSGNGVRAARYDAAGAPLGSERAVNSATANDQQLAAVSCTASGELVVVWESRGQDGDDFGIIARSFDASGEARGAELQVNSHTTDRQRAAAVCSDEDGGFVVAWHSYDQDGDGYGVFAQRFDGAGARRGAELQVNSFTAESQAHPAITCSASGFVVVWQSAEQDGDGYGVVARRWDRSGAPLGTEFAVNTTTDGNQRRAAVAADGAGFLIVWESDDDQDGDGSGIFARRFAADGTPEGAEIPVNALTDFDQEQPALAVAPPGFVAAWSSASDGDEHGIFARRLDAAGVPRGAEFQVNAYTLGVQGAFSDEGRALAAAAGPAGELAVVWHSARTVGRAQDGDGFGVFGRRLDGAPACAGDCSGDLAVGIDELVLGVTLILNDGPAAACPALDGDGDGRIGIAELVAAVRSALDGCPQAATSRSAR